MAVDLTAVLKLKDEFSSGLSKIQSRVAGFGSTGEKVAGAIAGLGMGKMVKDFGKDVVQTGMDFTSSISKLSAVSGAEGKVLDSLRDKAMEMGAETVFSATEASEAMTYLGMAGFDANEIIATIPDTLALASAGGLDLARSADIASNVMSGFGMMAGDVEANMKRVADVLAYASANSNTSVEQLGDAMSYVAPVAHSYGIALEEVAGAIGVMSDAGIQGSRSGMSMKNILSSLANPVGSTKKKLEELGISFDKVNPETNSFVEILQNLEEAGMKSSDAIALVGSEAGPGLSALLSLGSEGVKKFIEDLEGAEGTAGSMSEAMVNNLGGDLKALESKWETVKLTLFFGQEGILRDTVQVMIKGVDLMINHLPKLNKALSVSRPLLIGFATALGVVASAVTAVLIVKSLVGIISLLANPVGIAVLAIGALASAFGYAWKYSETFRNAIKGTAKAFGDFKKIFSTEGKISADDMADMTGLGQKIAQAKNKFIDFKNTITEFASNVKEMFSNLFSGDSFDMSKLFGDGALGDFAQSLYDRLQQGLTAFENFKTSIKEKVSEVEEFFSNMFGGDGEGGGIGDKFSGLFDGIKDAFGNVKDFIDGEVKPFFEQLGEVISPLVEVIGTNLGRALSGVINAISGILGGLASVFGGIFSAVVSVVGGIFKAVISIVAGAFKGLFLVIATIGKVIGSVFKAIAPIILAIIPIITVVINIVMTIVTTIINVIGSLIGGIFNILGTIVGVITGFIGVIIGGLVQLIGGAIGGLIQFIMAFISGLIAIVGGFVTGFYTLLEPLITGLSEMITGAVEFISEKIEQFKERFGSFREFMVEVFQRVVSTIQNFKEAGVTAFTAVKEKATEIGNAIKSMYESYAKPAIDGIKEALSSMGEKASEVFDSYIRPFADFMGGAFSTAIDLGKTALEGLKTIFEGVGKAVGKVVGKVKDFADRIKNIKMPSFSGLNPFSNYHGIGEVPYNNYPTFLHKGERVLTAQENRELDNAINAGLLGKNMRLSDDVQSPEVPMATRPSGSGGSDVSISGGVESGNSLVMNGDIILQSNAQDPSAVADEFIKQLADKLELEVVFS